MLNSSPSRNDGDFLIFRALCGYSLNKNEYRILYPLARMGFIFITAGQRPAVDNTLLQLPERQDFAFCVILFSPAFQAVALVRFCPQAAALPYLRL
jgi:hypothetical protein